MRIISSFRDYYDTVQAYGQDQSVRFLRETAVVKDLAPWAVPMPWDGERSSHGRYDGGPIGPDYRVIRAGPFHRDLMGLREHRDDQVLEEGFVFIGGKAHALWLNVDRTQHHYGPGPAFREGEGKIHEPAPQPLGFPDEATAVAWWTRHLRQPRFDGVAPLGPDDELNVRAREFEGKSAARDANTYASLRERVLAHDWAALHLTHESPVLLVVPPRRGRYWFAGKEKEFKASLIVNPRLADFQLPHHPAFDPYSVFQVLAQFIGGVMPGGQAPLVALTDRDQVRKKGFDPVYGFRTRPQAAR